MFIAQQSVLAAYAGAVGLVALVLGVGLGLALRRIRGRRADVADVPPTDAHQGVELQKLREDARTHRALLNLTRTLTAGTTLHSLLQQVWQAVPDVLGVVPAEVALGVARGARVRWEFSGNKQEPFWTSASLSNEAILTADEARRRLGLGEARLGSARWCVILPCDLGAQGRQNVASDSDQVQSSEMVDRQDMFGDGGVTAAALVIWFVEQPSELLAERGRLLAAQVAPALQRMIADDISARHEHRLRVLFDVAPIGLFLANRSMTSVRINAAGARIFGVNPAENLGIQRGLPQWEMRQNGVVVPLEQYPSYRAAVGGETVLNERYRVIAQQSKVDAELLISAAPIRRPDDLTQTDGAVVAFVDVGELVALQSELECRRREAEETALQKNRFFAAVSHDIRNPANAINLLSELMLQTKPEDVATPDFLETVREMRTCAQRLSQLVGDVLDITRLDLGKVEISPCTFELGAFLLEEAASHRTAAIAKGLELQLRDIPSPAQVYTDKPKVSRILSNLISNAIKFTDGDMVWITAVVMEAGSLAISVHDRGPGVPEMSRASIFDEFTQLRRISSHERRGVSTSESGVGLGLSISRRLARAIGGDLILEDRPGPGSTFTLNLPAQTVRGVA